MTTTAFRGGTVVDQAGERTVDVVVDDRTGLVSALSDGAEADVSVDAEGCLVLPGFVDLHSHLRQPGNEAAETIETGSRAAALGGFTAVVAMPNTTPCMDSAAVIAEVLDYAKSALCEVKPSAAITIGRDGEVLAPMGELIELGVRMFTDDGTGVQDDQLMRRALEYAGSLVVDDGTSIVLSQHCEVTALSQGGVMHEGAWSSRLGLPGQPAEAEELMVMRDIALSRLTGVPVHMQHLSTAGSVALVRAAKAEGHPVTAEACPHHFTLTDALCASYDPVYKVHPPLRTDTDVAAIKAGLADGTIDAIATDHAPHSSLEKDCEFQEASPGLIGLELVVPVLLELVRDGKLPLHRFIASLTSDAAKVIDLQAPKLAEKHVADLCLIAPERTHHVDASTLRSKCTNSPFVNRSYTGSTELTMVGGRVIFRREP